MTAPLVVVDASIALAWYLPDSDANYRYAKAIRLAQWRGQISPAVPDFWSAEIAYRLLKASRSSPSPMAIGLDEAAAALDRFPRSTYATPQGVSQITALALHYQLQGWDALYFDIAVRHHATLATLDGGLKTAARKFGVPLWEMASV